MILTVEQKKISYHYASVIIQKNHLIELNVIAFALPLNQIAAAAAAGFNSH